MAYRFIPPTTDETRPVAPEVFLWWYGTAGVSILKESGAYRQVLNPSQAELEAATTYYLGTHVYYVDDAEGSALSAAGYGSYLTYIGPDATPGLYSDIYYDTYTGAY